MRGDKFPIWHRDATLIPGVGLTLLDEISLIVEPVDRTLYEIYEVIARDRIASRDVEAWPWLPLPCCWLVLSGRKTRTFSRVELLYGLPTKSNFTCTICNRYRSTL